MTAGYSEDDAAMQAVVLAGLRSAKSMREIAVDRYGARQVAVEWHRDGWMRPMVQWLVHRARAAPDEGPDSTDPGTR